MITFILSYALFVGEFLYRELFLRKGGISKQVSCSKHDKGSTRFAGITIVVGFWIPIILFLFNIQILINHFISWFGVLLIIIGIAIQIIAVKTLGKFYARSLVIQEKHIVIRNGIYKYIRHPGYLGGILIWEGFGLGTGNWIAFILISILNLSFYIYRIYFEEKMLIEKFGKEYTYYAKSTSRLIPFIF